MYLIRETPITFLTDRTDPIHSSRVWRAGGRGCWAQTGHPIILPIRLHSAPTEIKSAVLVLTVKRANDDVPTNGGCDLGCRGWQRLNLIIEFPRGKAADLMFYFCPFNLTSTFYAFITIFLVYSMLDFEFVASSFAWLNANLYRTMHFPTAASFLQIPAPGGNPQEIRAFDHA